MFSEASEKKASPAVTAVCLFSGGLDSRLAARLVLDQGIGLLAVHFSSVFVAEETSDDVSGIADTACEFGMAVECLDISSELIRLVKAPPHGHGSQLNPCIDCRILQLRKAREVMAAIGARFLVTGEVVGQRPMTQRKDMLRHIDKEAGVSGRVLRPLSARIMEPTRPEKEGLIDRERLGAFSGRTRSPQIRLAAELGIRNYPPPAGGCRLTEPGYSRRLNDLLRYHQFNEDNLELLLTGRHFRLDDRTKVVVGRDHSENERIKNLAECTDALLCCSRHPGPTALLRGDCTEENLVTAARITARYGKTRDMEEVEVDVKAPRNKKLSLRIAPAGHSEFDALLL